MLCGLVGLRPQPIKAVSVVAAMACLLCFPVKASATAQQGTNGTELEVVQAQQLEIQLGQAWTGVEFQLRTDAGKYPDPIPVGEDGVLRVEIGGSENYLLTCLASQVEVPSPEDLEAVEETADPEATIAEGTEESETESAAATEESQDTTEGADEPESTIDVTDPDAEQGPAMIGNVPVAHVVIFVGGLVIAIALLVFMQMHQKNRQAADAEEDDDGI